MSPEKRLRRQVGHPSRTDRHHDSGIHPDRGRGDAGKRILDAFSDAEARGAGAAALDGQMVDEAIAVSAPRVLAQAEEQ
ncbi:hypothetical protein [Williamsia sp. DF01-3]|uniref:hypothetical protein n=1 Tax=Williamsia sp. DF01-3 TaxID=2934157 RepID=UPI001FF10DC0|nr:hypothetical protein [Williamsia sp. DF01-3]MCK0516677.1 hypothetical protein [Williamsia sp. DF01-3]